MNYFINFMYQINQSIIFQFYLRFLNVHFVWENVSINVYLCVAYNENN